MHLKTIVDHYYCINSTINSPKFTISTALVLLPVHSKQVVGLFPLYSCPRAKPYIRAINGSAIITSRGMEQVYSRYQICALTACALPC